MSRADNIVDDLEKGWGQLVVMLKQYGDVQNDLRDVIRDFAEVLVRLETPKTEDAFNEVKAAILDSLHAFFLPMYQKLRGPHAQRKAAERSSSEIMKKITDRMSYRRSKMRAAGQLLCDKPPDSETTGATTGQWVIHPECASRQRACLSGEP